MIRLHTPPLLQLVLPVPLLVLHIFRNLCSSATPSAWHIGASLYGMDDDWAESVQWSVGQALNSDHDPGVDK